MNSPLKPRNKKKAQDVETSGTCSAVVRGTDGKYEVQMVAGVKVKGGLKDAYVISGDGIATVKLAKLAKNSAVKKAMRKFSTLRSANANGG